MTFTDLAKSYVRTIVPAVVGAIIAWALHHGHDIHGYEAQLTVVITGLYYGLARLLEHYVSPRFGWLLGAATAPLYRQVKPGPVKHPKGSRGYGAVEVLLIVLLVIVILVLVGVLR